MILQTNNDEHVERRRKRCTTFFFVPTTIACYLGFEVLVISYDASHCCLCCLGSTTTTFILLMMITMVCHLPKSKTISVSMKDLYVIHNTWAMAVAVLSWRRSLLSARQCIHRCFNNGCFVHSGGCRDHRHCTSKHCERLPYLLAAFCCSTWVSLLSKWRWLTAWRRRTRQNVE